MSVTSSGERASREEVTLNSNLSSKLQLAGMPFYTTTKQLFGTSLSSWVWSFVCNGRVLIQPFEPGGMCVRTCSRSCKFKTTKIYSQGILVNYTKICTNENFPLYGTPHCVLLFCAYVWSFLTCILIFWLVTMIHVIKIECPVLM